jgi:hypothetical protein
MKSRQLLSVVSLMLLTSCTGQVSNLTLACADLSGKVYTGDMKNSAGVVLATVTLDFRDNHPPGFKHNVQMTPPPSSNLTPQDVECSDRAPPTTLTVYKSETSPPLASKEATWAMLSVVPPGFAFTLQDTGSSLFPTGAQGSFKQ